jgi:hypothetical protein
MPYTPALKPHQTILLISFASALGNRGRRTYQTRQPFNCSGIQTKESDRASHALSTLTSSLDIIYK